MRLLLMCLLMLCRVTVKGDKTVQKEGPVPDSELEEAAEPEELAKTEEGPVETPATNGSETVKPGEDISTTGKPIYGADHQPMEGGTLVKIYYPYAVPIKQRGTLMEGSPNYPCFGVISGHSAAAKRLLFTSSYCDVEGHIDKEFTSDNYEDVAITRVLSPLRRKREVVVHVTYPFSVWEYTLEYFRRLDESVFNEPGVMITDANEYHKIITNTKSIGIVLAARPYKAGVVSLDQTQCNDFAYKIRKHPEMPENLTTGVFCVFKGNNTSVNFRNQVIEPGLPCRDSLGSPVLVEGPAGYNRVLGIIMMYFCEYTPEEWGDIPMMAIATSMAYAFNTTALPSPRTLATRTWPPWPSRSAERSTKPSPVAPRGESPSTSFNKVIILCVAIMWSFLEAVTST